ncbi:RNA polymerase sigma factor [Nocardioides rubriscoriae]|uniref:RNA polymerase sigma factor n=1 Tax=Nocardioides rubriscoriae TaxID=642762 RepID=UPI0011DFE075|nr:sigma-70 family RNA polymerase sigma factor [Nocardioides rubriscoriae]
MSDETDASAFDALLRAAREGDSSALASLWHQFSGAVAAFARARGAADPDEVTNDVFLAAFRCVGDFEGDVAGFRALLFTIARRRVSDDLRRRSRRVAVVSWSPADDGSALAPSAEDFVIGRAAQDDLLRLVDDLTADQRDVILLRLVADLSIEEVAGVLGKRPGTVKSLQRRGLDSLRRALGAAPASTPPTHPHERAAR